MFIRSRSRDSISKHSGALMSSRLMPPNVGSRLATMSQKRSGVGLVDLDVEHVDPGELLEQHRLAFHDGLCRERSDGAETEHRGPVGHHRDEVRAGGQARRLGRIGRDRVAGCGDARRVGEREVVLARERLGGADRELARHREAVVGERVVGESIGHGFLPRRNAAPEVGPCDAGIVDASRRTPHRAHRRRIRGRTTSSHCPFIPPPATIAGKRIPCPRTGSHGSGCYDRVPSRGLGEMTRDRNKLPTRSSSADVDAFLRDVAAITPAKRTKAQGRLLFAMDATASREPMWDRACQIQSEMFTDAARVGGLAVQLCHYGGFYGFESTRWLTGSAALLRHMSAVRCAAGMTQIERVLRHAKAEAERARVNAVVFVGDCMEEDVDRVCAAAGPLRLLNVPVFVFQEGHDPVAERAFREIATPDPRRVLPVRCLERSGAARPVCARSRSTRREAARRWRTSDGAKGVRSSCSRTRSAGESSPTCTRSCCSSRSSRCCSSSVGTSESPRRSNASSDSRHC